MKSISTLAIAAALALGAAAPTMAQEAPAPTPIKLSKDAQKPILELQTAVTAKDAAAYAAALPSAQAAATSSDDHFAIARLQLSHAINTNDEAGQIAAVEGMIANIGQRTADLPKLQSVLLGLYRKSNNFDKAGEITEKMIAANPNDTNAILTLADIRTKQNRTADAAALAQQAMKVSEAAGQPTDVKVLRYALDLALQAKLQPQSLQMARQLFEVSKETRDRRNALLILRQNTNLNDDAMIDLLRLMRKANLLESQNEYLTLATSLGLGHFYAEANEVVKEAQAAGKAGNPQFAEVARLASAKVAEDKAALPGLVAKARAAADGKLALNVANGFFGHGDYQQAADLYRTALQKGVADKDLANTRLGIALAMLGQRAEAEAAFKAVGGSRAPVADYWMLWLANPA